MKFHSKKAEKFFHEKVSELINDGITVNLDRHRNISTGQIKCRGFFDANDKALHVAVGAAKKQWFVVFVHEYCHYLQWKEDLWLELGWQGDIDGWYSHEVELSYQEALEVTRDCQDCELDCEKRTVTFLEGMGIDIPNYIRQANAYVLLYQMCLEKQAWMDASPSQVKELLAVTPDYWLDDYTTLWPEFRKAAEKCFRQKKGRR